MKTTQIISTMICVFLMFSSFKTSTTENINKQYNSIDFKVSNILFENDQIKIKSEFNEHQVTNRSVIKNYLLLTVTNKTNKKLNIKYKIDAYYNGECPTYNGFENIYSLNLNKKETKSGTFESNKSLKIFHSFKTGESNSILTDLRIVDVIIKKA